MEGATLGNTIEHLSAVPHRRPTDSLHGRCHLLCLLCRSFIAVIGVAKVYWPSNEASAVFMWMAAATLLSVPWFFCWTRLESL